MAHRWKTDLTWNDVTPEAAFLNRRQILAGAAGAAALSIAGGALAKGGDLDPNSWEEITSYNNFYESAPARTIRPRTRISWSPNPGRSPLTAWWTGRATIPSPS